MIRFVLITGAVAAAVLVLTALVAWRLVRRAGRRFGRWETRFLDLRSQFLSPGPRRDANRLRVRLHAEMRATRDLLATAPQGLIFRADAAGVLRELTTTADALDGELLAVERFLDHGQQRAALDALAPQVEQVIGMTYTARRTVLQTAAEDRVRHLSALHDNVTSQATALETYRRNGRELSL